MKLLFAILFLLLSFPAILEAGKLRVVSLAPSLTETMFQVGCGDLLVGRTDKCNYPSGATGIPVVGRYGSPSIEKLIEVRPDIVIVDSLRDPAQGKIIKSLGIKLCKFKSQSITDYLETVNEMGNLFDCRKAADTEIGRIKKGLKKYEKLNRGIKQREKVLIVIWDNPLITCGKKSFLTSYIYYAGGVNVAAEHSKNYFQASLEWIFSLKPDIILCPDLKAQKVKQLVNSTGWRDLEAVKQKRVYSDMNTDILFRMGPRMFKAIDILKRYITPGKSEK